MSPGLVVSTLLAVSEASGIRVSVLKSPGSRAHRIARVRWILWSLLREGGMSLPQIGKLTREGPGSWDHTTVRSGVVKLPARLERDESLRAIYERTRAALAEESPARSPAVYELSDADALTIVCLRDTTRLLAERLAQAESQLADVSQAVALASRYADRVDQVERINAGLVAQIAELNQRLARSLGESHAPVPPALPVKH